MYGTLAKHWFLKKIVYRTSWYLKGKHWGKSLNQPKNQMACGELKPMKNWMNWSNGKT
jgi:hypothetical protein